MSSLFLGTAALAVSFLSLSLLGQKPPRQVTIDNSPAPNPHHAPSRPLAALMGNGHPDFTGFCKGDRKTKPVGNIGKDLPVFKLPLTAAGQAALQHNLTQTVDPESLCIIGGIPRHEIGRWDGDTLVIDSIAFKDEKVWIDQNANPHSDALHVGALDATGRRSHSRGSFD
jgi:hypothetical protein